MAPRRSSTKTASRQDASFQLTTRFVFIAFLFSGSLLAQNASTGAMAGIVTETTGAVLPSTHITVTNESTRVSRSAVTRSDGSYTVPLLPPGTYTVSSIHKDFKTTVYDGIEIRLAETTRFDIQMPLGQVREQVSAAGIAPIVQTESATLGHLVGESTIEALPLVTRNYTQILGLSPGVNVDVTNAAELGRGSGGSQGDTTGAKHVNGGMQYDNNFEMNGVQVNDAFGAGVRFGGVDGSGGVPVPNPDTIQQFKVQTGQYDAEFGRNAGSNVQIITKGGSNSSMVRFLSSSAMKRSMPTTSFENLQGRSDRSYERTSSGSLWAVR